MEPPVPDSDPDFEHLDSGGVERLGHVENHNMRLWSAAMIVAVIAIVAVGALVLFILCGIESWQVSGYMTTLFAIYLFCQSLLLWFYFRSEILEE